MIEGEQISFRLDDHSGNGTFLNGKQITEDVELLPEDTIEPVKNGVKFIFDVQPRPGYMVARTRVRDLSDSSAPGVTKIAEVVPPTAVHVMKAAAIATPAAVQDAAARTNEPPQKQVIGIFTYRRSGGGAVTTAAIPIKCGRDLLLSQYP
jgi:pSer/pThr/pTyr-binding forkhead associated (FHA) protein